jgi:hypothetical protein
MQRPYSFPSQDHSCFGKFIHFFQHFNTIRRICQEVFIFIKKFCFTPRLYLCLVRLFLPNRPRSNKPKDPRQSLDKGRGVKGMATSPSRLPASARVVTQKQEQQEKLFAFSQFFIPH